MQRLTTREPDDKMIEVAIASVEEVFDWEAYQRWCRSEKARREEKAKAGSVKKSRAQIREELLERERENKQRATERARQILEDTGTDSQKTQEVDNVKSINAQGMDTGKESTVKKSGAKVINLSDYK